MSPGAVDWSQEQAEVIVKSLTRYTKFVRSTKMGLGVISLILIALILFYPLLHKKDAGLRISFSSTNKPDENPTTMSNPKFIGLDKDNQPFNFSAKTAAEMDKDRVSLDNPNGDILLKSNKHLFVVSRSGIFNKKEKKLNLTGDVTMSDEQGNVMHTETIFVDIANKSAATSNEVHGSGPLGTIKAYGGAMADGNNEQLLFEGPVFVTLNMKSKVKETEEKPR